MGPKLWEILFIFIFLINRLPLPSSISEWVFLSFIWCSLSPPTIHIQPYWILRLRDPSFGHQRSITNDNIKVSLWAWPSKCRSTKQVIMLGFKIGMNKHVFLKFGELNCEGLNLERFWGWWWTCGRCWWTSFGFIWMWGFNEKKTIMWRFRPSTVVFSASEWDEWRCHTRRLQGAVQLKRHLKPF